MQRMKRTWWLVAVLALALVAAACTGGDDDGGPSGDDGSDGGVTEIVLWHGYGSVGGEPDAEFQSLLDLVAEFNDTHPDIHVESIRCCSNDKALEKVTVALQGDQAPDITYQYGSSLPQLAAAPGLVDLTEWSQEADVAYDDFIAGAREAGTFEGKVLGVPALIDNLAIVYNKELFAQAGVEEPTADWTWDDFRAAAAALTDASTQTFGFGFPADASEDSVWHFDPMLWQAGGSILSEDGTQATFNSEAGVRALDVLRGMAVDDQSVYLDLQNTKLDDLFNTGKIAMLITGPWALSGYPDIDYGVQVLPSFDGDHQTIAGPDFWVVFDNGDERRDAALTFLQWFTAPEQIQTDSEANGHLPTRSSVIEEPGFTDDLESSFPGVGTFAENLTNVQQARPVLATYPQISVAMGEAVVAAMLGEKTSQEALDDAANEVNDILSLPA
jgi:multiple sugar transport system substrate-binding protein